MQRSSFGVQYAKGPWRWQLARTNQGYLRANSNALLLAAQNESRSEVDLDTPGQFQLRAEAWTLQATTLSATYTWKASEILAIALEPHLQLIHDFQHTRANFLLSNAAGSSVLMGEISKTGTRNYGYLPNDQRDEGMGAGLHVRTSWRRPWGQVDLAFQNLLSHIQFSVVHQQNRRYNVLAQGNKLNVADTPSVTGDYGITRSRERLPMHWHLAVSPDATAGASVGLLGLGDEVRWAASYSLSAGGGQWLLRTVHARNWTLGYAKSLGTGWKLAVGVSTDQRFNGAGLSTASLTKSW